MSIHRKIFEQLIKVVPIVKTNKVSGKSKSSGFMDFNYDLLNTDDNKKIKHIALSHYYKHDSGDLIPDPDMTMLVHLVDKAVYAISYQDMYRYDHVDSDCPEAIKNSLNEFLLTWLQNLDAQEHHIS